MAVPLTQWLDLRWLLMDAVAPTIGAGAIAIIPALFSGFFRILAPAICFRKVSTPIHGFLRRSPRFFEAATLLFAARIAG
ncbi:MAG TPA: hypothetical protein VGH23_13620 [Rhizomicrobium sp.]